jgi:biotin carboxyl carrier protein
MRVSLAVDGKDRVIEVDLDAGTIALDGRSLPFRVVTTDAERVELEILGERLVVLGWPDGVPQPLKELSVNGERVTASVHDRELSRRSIGGSAAPPPARSRSPLPVPEGPQGPGVIVPPMPGKVVEVRVRIGEAVAKGQVLLVLEAMKMRNDLVAPFTGKVAELTVTAGENVRARQLLVRLDPT